MKPHSEKIKAWQYFQLNFVITMAFCLCMPPASAQTNGSEWILEQNLADTGNLTLYVTHDAIKIVISQWGYNLLAKAPRWTVHCFRPEEKIQWIGNLDAFNHEMLQNPLAVVSKNGANYAAFETGSWRGLKYTRYAPSRRSRTGLYAAEDIAVSPQATDFVCRFYAMPDPGKLPLYYRRDKGAGGALDKRKNEWLTVDVGRDLRGGLVAELVTTSWKKVPFKASDFEYPQGYKTLRSAPEVAYSNKQKETMNDVLNEVGFSSDLGSGHKRVPMQKGSQSTGQK